MTIKAKVLKNFTCFVDGYGFMGRVEEIETPKLKLKTEDVRLGGMDAPEEVDLGMEKLELTLTFAEAPPELLTLFGFANGLNTSVTLRQAVQGDGEAEAIVINARGGIKELDEGNLKTGAINKPKFAIALSYYKRTQAGKRLVEIDVPNMVRIIGDTDFLAGQRKSLGY